MYQSETVTCIETRPFDDTGLVLIPPMGIVK